MSEKYSEYDHLPRAAGTSHLTPGAACTYLHEGYGLKIRPTTIAHRLNDIAHYRNRFGNLSFAFEDLDTYASMFEVTKFSTNANTSVLVYTRRYC